MAKAAPKPDASAPLRVTVAIDRTKREKRGTLRAMTEDELIGEALRLRPGVDVEDFILAGALAYATQIVTYAKSPGRRESGRAAGQADSRIRTAYRAIVAENKQRERDGKKPRKISPSTLMVAAATNFATAKRWLDTHAAAAS